MRSKLVKSTRPRAVACAALAAIALGLAACGDSGDEAADTTAAPTATTPDPVGDRSEPPVASAPVGGGRGPALTGDRAQAQAGAAALDEVYAGLEAAAAAGVANYDVPATDTLETAGDDERLGSVCALLSDEAKRQTVTYAKRSAGLADVAWTCERAVGLLLRRAAQGGSLKRATRARVLGVNTEGDRATATVRVGGRNGRVTTLSLVKEDGTWKLGTTPGGQR